MSQWKCSFTFLQQRDTQTPPNSIQPLLWQRYLSITTTIPHLVVVWPVIDPMITSWPTMAHCLIWCHRQIYPDPVQSYPGQEPVEVGTLLWIHDNLLFAFVWIAVDGGWCHDVMMVYTYYLLYMYVYVYVIIAIMITVSLTYYPTYL